MEVGGSAARPEIGLREDLRWLEPLQLQSQELAAEAAGGVHRSLEQEKLACGQHPAVRESGHPLRAHPQLLPSGIGGGPAEQDRGRVRGGGQDEERTEAHPAGGTVNSSTEVAVVPGRRRANFRAMGSPRGHGLGRWPLRVVPTPQVGVRHMNRTSFRVEGFQVPVRSKGTKGSARAAPSVRKVSTSPTGRRVYMVTGGVTKFAKAHPAMDFRLMVKRAYDYALKEMPNLTKDRIDGTRISYFSDHFSRQLKAASMVQDYLGMNPKGSVPDRMGRGHGRGVFPGRLRGGGERTDGRLSRGGVRDNEPSRDVEGERVHRPRLRHELRLPPWRVLHGVLRLMVMRHIYEYLRLTRFAHVKDEREAQHLAIREGSGS